jgi:polyadenylation factor subunit 2
VFQPRPPVPPIYQATEFDGKRLRKAIARKTVDYNSSVTRMLETRLWQRDYRDSHALHPDIGYYTEVCFYYFYHYLNQNILCTTSAKLSLNTHSIALELQLNNYLNSRIELIII